MENMTYEKLLELFAITDAKIAKVSELQAEYRANDEVRWAKNDANWAKNDANWAKNDANWAKNEAQYEARWAKNEAQYEARWAKTEAQMAKTDKRLAALATEVGNITDSLGRFAEEQVRPKILQLFKDKGIELDEIYPRVVVKKDGQFFLEIDLVLVNTIYSVIVEVKNTLRQKDVDEHLDRMEKLQTLPAKMLKGTTMFGAVAGMIVTDEVEYYAIKKGLYVIKTKGDNVEISNKKSFQGKQWQILA
jgi:hypothetical protein